jgi:hypothetical protein
MPRPEPHPGNVPTKHHRQRRTSIIDSRLVSASHLGVIQPRKKGQTSQKHALFQAHCGYPGPLAW